nr:MAG TPA: hypothetical protein [Caudoviricetes sp.]
MQLYYSDCLGVKILFLVLHTPSKAFIIVLFDMSKFVSLGKP